MTQLVEITRGQKTPCGECHLRPGETCDICDAREPGHYDKIALDATSQIERIPSDIPATQRVARIQLIVLSAIKATALTGNDRSGT